MNSFLKYNLLSILWTILILVLCLMPGKDLPSVSIWEFDKLAHFGIYLILALLMYYGWKKQNFFLSLRQNTLIKILILTSAYGFAVEIMQELFTADRHFELLDALANSTGAIAGSFAGISLKQTLSL
ncbi:MAG: VanZ family protein [Bacteroidetes bacterium]|nr:VanZ family protein [Bacteroidota bacterium]